MDISFHDITGEIEPDDSVEVTLTKAGLDASTVRVVHIKDDGTLEGVNNVTAEPNAVKFRASDFSVYAIIDDDPSSARATVNFYKADGTIAATYYVKNDDTAAEMEQFVVDPGAGTLGDHKVFRGWFPVVHNEDTPDPTYDDNTEIKTIDGIRTYLAELTITNGMVINVYPMIFNAWTLTYLDENGSAFQTVPFFTTQDSIVYHVTMSYSPHKQNANFDGWLKMVMNNNNELVQEGTTVVVPASGGDLTINSDTYLKAFVPEGYWLVFNENGKGATFVAAQFVKSGDNTQAPAADMVRKGYSFDGWYLGNKTQKLDDDNQPVFDENGDPVYEWSLDETYSNQFNFGGQLTETTYVYAKWKPNTTANYTVIIWKQNIQGNGYDFAEAINLTGDVGSTINTVVQTGSNVNTGATPVQTRNVRVNGTEKAYTGFHCSSFETGKTIAADGSTVLNVYYDRNTITVNFDAGNNNYILDENDNTYKRQVTYTGLYEAPLTFTWPTRYYGNNNGTGNRTNTLWRYSSGGSYTNLSFIGSFKLPNPASVTISLTRSSAGSYPRRFIQQNIDGTWPVEAHDTIYMSGTSFTITDKYTGFYAYQYRRHTSSSTSTTGFDNWTTLGDPDSEGDYTTVNNAYQLEIRFARVKARITYMDGAYVDGEGSPTETPTYQQLSQTDEMYYGVDVTSYGKDKTNYYKPTAPDGYVFEGWYADKNCTQEYKFTTMPSEGITVYAKWRQIQYRVFLHPNAGNDGSLDWGNETQGMNFRVTYGGTVADVKGRRTEYDFIGWYTDTACTNAWAPNIQVLNDNTVTSSYDKTTDMTDTMDKWGNISDPIYNSDLTGYNGGERFWIIRKLDLYAKWSARLVGAKGIDIVYLAGDGTNAPTDLIQYADNADVVAAAAATAPEGKQFSHWVVQKWNGTDFVDTNVTVVPGGTFKALKVNAKSEQLATSPEEEPKYKYTIQLLAVYKDIEEPIPTHIYWYANNGTDGVQKDTVLQINVPVDIPTLDTWKNGEIQHVTGGANTGTVGLSYHGHKFLGWARLEEGSGRDPSTLTEADLWLKWVEATDTVAAHYETIKPNTSDNTWVTTSQVACDEKLPYHDLYAVWKQEYFFVYNSSNGTLTAHAMPDTKDGIVDLSETPYLRDGYFYAGYYSATVAATEENVTAATVNALKTPGTAVAVAGATPYAGDPIYSREIIRDDQGKATDVKINYFWNAGYGVEDSTEDAYTADGTKLVPEVNKVYYLKEISDKYLSTKVYFVYDRDTGEIQDIYFISIIDDDRTYSELGNGVDSDAKTYITPAVTFVVAKQGSKTEWEDETVNVRPNTFGLEHGYLMVQRLSDFVGKGFEGHPFYKTLDGYLKQGNVAVVPALSTYSTTTNPQAPNQNRHPAAYTGSTIVEKLDELRIELPDDVLLVDAN